MANINKNFSDADLIWKSLNEEFNKLSDKTVLSKEIQHLITTLRSDWTKLSRLNSQKEGFTQSIGKVNETGGAHQELFANIENLKAKLHNLSYSNSEIIDTLLKSINKLLEKLADFFMNGPLIAEGVYIPNPNAEPHRFNFFQPARSAEISLEHLTNAFKAAC